MIPAAKSPAFERLFHLYNLWLLRRSFHLINVRIDLCIDTDRPAFYFANHASWWDGLLAFQLNRSLLKQDAYVMMSEEGLTKFRFFQKLGAFSVNRESVTDIKESLAYSRQCLEKPTGALWLFPQGEIQHQDARPLTFKPGMRYLLDKIPEVQLVPVTFYYTFLQEQKPEVYIHLGAPLDSAELHGLSRADKLACCQQALTAQLDELRSEIIHGTPQGFSALIRGESSTSTRFARFFGRA